MRSHAAGVGPSMLEREVRALMLLRANVLAKASPAPGPSSPTCSSACSTHRCTRRCRSREASVPGGLAPLAHLALSMIGEGSLSCNGSSGPADAMLRRAGLRPVALGAKEGLTLINGTQAHTGIAALAIVDAHRLWHTAHVAGAMSLEALLGTPVAFDERIQNVRGQLGQAASAALLRQLLADSEIRESHRHGDPRVQDAYSLRCMPQVHGPALDAIDFAAGLVGRELKQPRTTRSCSRLASCERAETFTGRPSRWRSTSSPSS